MPNDLYDVIIIGSGPAGLTAAIYTTRANLKTLVIAGRTWGGQLMLTSRVENFPGFPDGILGPDLMAVMRKQAENHGAEIVDVSLTAAEFSQQPFRVTTDDGKSYTGKSVIIATGADTKWLDVPGEKERIGRGVSSCATCDAPFYRGKKVIVAGGGDSAMEEALVLSKFADHVWVVHHRDLFRASEIMQKRVFENPKIDVIWNSAPIEILGEGKVERIRFSSKFKIQNSKLSIRKQNVDKEVTVEEIGGREVTANNQELTWEVPADGIFVAIGHMPNSGVFKGIDLDEKGFIKVAEHTRTNIEGVFAAGDVHDAEYKQAVTAAGFGCIAALNVEKWLETSG